MPRADRNRDRRQLVFVDEAQAGQRLGEVGAAVDQDRPFVVPSLQVRDLRAQVPAEDLGRSPFRLLQSVGEDSLRLLVHRGCDRPLGRGPVRAHDLVAAAAHRVDAGLLERAAVPLTRVVAEPLEHPFMGPVGAGDKTVEGHDHLENHFSIAHVGRDLPPRVNSSPIGGFGDRSAPARAGRSSRKGAARAECSPGVQSRADPRAVRRVRPRRLRVHPAPVHELFELGARKWVDGGDTIVTLGRGQTVRPDGRASPAKAWPRSEVPGRQDPRASSLSRTRWPRRASVGAVDLTQRKPAGRRGTRG